MNTTEESVEIIKSLDFEPDLACEFRSPLPQNPCVLHGEWVARCRKCGQSTVLCGPHKAAIEAIESPVACVRQPRAYMPMSALMEFFPIGCAS